MTADNSLPSRPGSSVRVNRFTAVAVPVTVFNRAFVRLAGGVPNREPVRQEPGSIRHTEPLQQRHRPLARHPRPHPDQAGWELHILDRGQLVDQMEGLEHEPHAVPAQPRPGRLRQPIDPVTPPRCSVPAVGRSSRAGSSSLYDPNDVIRGNHHIPPA